MTDDPATWSPMKRRAWAISLAAVSPKGMGVDLVTDAIAIERHVFGEPRHWTPAPPQGPGDVKAGMSFPTSNAAAAHITPGLTIRQQPFGGTP